MFSLTLIVLSPLTSLTGTVWVQNRLQTQLSPETCIAIHLAHLEMVSNYLQRSWCWAGCWAPFSRPHLYTLIVIPKGQNTGKWRLITDLAYPRNCSVNDGIEACLCSLCYTMVDDIAADVVALARGTLFASESAYRLIPVHPDDPMLPFGPKNFDVVADALHWVLQQEGIPMVYHYLDNFILVSLPHSQACGESSAIPDQVCATLKISMAAHKREGPATCLTVLGIEIDSDRGQLRLPTDKLSRRRQLLEEWGDRKVCSRKDLESLIGLLNHTCKVVQSSRSFLRSMLDLLHCTCSASPLPG